MSDLKILYSLVIHCERFGIHKSNLIALRKYINNNRSELPRDTPERNSWYNKDHHWEDYEFTSIDDVFTFTGDDKAYWSVYGEYDHLKNILSFTTGTAHLLFRDNYGNLFGWITVDGKPEQVNPIISLDGKHWC